MKTPDLSITGRSRLGSVCIRYFVPWLLLLLVGCSSSRSLMPTPSVYLENPDALFETLPDELQSDHLNLLFVTDREPINEAGHHSFTDLVVRPPSPSGPSKSFSGMVLIGMTC